MGASFDITGNLFSGVDLVYVSDTLLQKRPVVEHSPVLLLVALPYLLSTDDEILL